MVASASGPSSSSAGPLSTTSPRLRAPTTGARAMPRRSPASRESRRARWASAAAASCSVEARGGEPGLEAAALAARALGAAVGADDDVADLAGGEAAAEERDAAEQQAGTDTVADLDEHHVAVGVAEAVLGERGDVGVVGDEHRERRSGRPGCACSGSPLQPRLGALSTVPPRSTTPGEPTPMPRIGRVGCGRRARRRGR